MSYINSQKRVITQALHVISLVNLEMKRHGVKVGCSKLVDLQNEFEAWCGDNVTRVNWHAIAYTLNQAKPRRSLNDFSNDLNKVETELNRLLTIATN